MDVPFEATDFDALAGAAFVVAFVAFVAAAFAPPVVREAATLASCVTRFEEPQRI